MATDVAALLPLLLRLPLLFPLVAARGDAGVLIAEAGWSLIGEGTEMPEAALFAVQSALVVA